MNDILLNVDHAEPLEVRSDVLAVQYPQRLLGTVERVVETAVAAKRHVLLPQPGVVRVLDSISGIAADRVLVIGVSSSRGLRLPALERVRQPGRILRRITRRRESPRNARLWLEGLSPG